jgi:DNA-binding CsgD family transcriptional regulator
MKHTPDKAVFESDDLGALSEIVRVAYSDPLCTDTWSRVLDMIDGLVPYDVAGAVFVNVQSSRLEHRITSKASEEVLRSYYEHHLAIDTVAGLALSRKLSVWRPSDVIGEREWSATTIRNVLLDDFGYTEPMCVICGSPTEITARFWFLRSIEGCDFSERDRFVLGLLQPHLCQAMRHAKTILQRDVFYESFRQAMLPQFVLDSSGGVADMNDRAVLLVGDGDQKGLLPQIEAIAQGMIARSAFFESLEFAGRQCRVWMNSIVPRSAPTSYLLAIDSPDDLHQLLTHAMMNSGCSERETEVCMMLMRGASNLQIAEKLFISQATVKDHVASIMEKLGVAHRSAILSKLLGI